MGRIHVLDTRVADQIAAGEVVERPASVVKELVENALDAGAARVQVEVDGGGLKRITVVDDGGGMDAADAVLCFSRHATSKLASADDLLKIGTFGFRGEALAAIASVARVRLLTRRGADDEAAHEVRVEGGRVAHVGDAGAPPGTRIDVEDLFFNTPARKKFLKSERTEAGHIEDAVAAAALCLPNVAFRVVVDGKPVLDLPAAPTAAAPTHPLRIERAIACLGKHVRPHLFPFEASTELIALTGFVVAPLETRRDLAGVCLSVNARPVSDRGLVQAVRTAFRTLLEVGRQPIVGLDIRIDPALVDVNVHPRKSEVRFVDPRRVYGHVIALLSDFLAGTPWLKSAPTSTIRPRVMFLSEPPSPASPSPLPTSSSTSPDTPVDGLADEHRARVRAALARWDTARGPALPSQRPLLHDVTGGGGGGAGGAFGSAGGGATGAPRNLSLVPVAGVGGAANFSSLRVIGQVGATYLVLEAPEGMVVIDQHAAHERVVFERLRARREQSPSQPLLIPITIDLSPLEMSALDDEDGRALLERHGLVIEPFGPRTAVVKAVPPGLDGKKAEAIARDALAEMAAGSAPRASSSVVSSSSLASSSVRMDTNAALDDRVDRVCARLACHAAIRAGDAMSPESVRALLRDLDAIDLGAHCPHGRPVVRAVRYEELAQWFDRR